MERATQVLPIIAAAAILACVIFTPRVAVVKGTVLKAFRDDASIAAVVDVRTVGIYVLGIVTATLLFWLGMRETVARSDGDSLRARMDSLELRLDELQKKLSDDISALESHLTEP